MSRKVLFYKGKLYFSADTVYVPTKLSQLQNDVGYLTTETDPTVPSWAKASSKPSYTFSEIGSKPTTISGYGITDAKINNGVITLGNNTITPLTSHSNSYGKLNMDFDSGGSYVTYGDSASSNNSNFPNLYFSNNFPASYNSGTRTLTFDGSIYVRKAGDTVNGALYIANNSCYIKRTTADLTKSNNGISSNLYNYYGFQDKNNKYSGFYGCDVCSNGDVQVGLYARNYKTDGTAVDHGIVFKITKTGTKSVSLDSSIWRSALGIGNAKINEGRTGWGTSSGSVSCNGNHFIIITDKWFGVLWLAGTNDIHVNYVHTDGKAYNAAGTGSVSWGNGKYTATRNGTSVTVTSTSNSSITLIGV